ncbi:MAG: histidine kinase [Oscillospiraceae bacterium]|nr:histidine kinase [Oscillospiraceae bacterium]
MEKEKHTKKRLSLKWSTTILIVLCWVLPIFCIVGLGGSYIIDNFESQTQEMAMTSVQNAVKLTKSQLDASITASRNASYNSTIVDAYNKYQKDGDVLSFHSTVQTYLAQQYNHDDRFLSAALCFFNEPDDIFFSSMFIRPSESLYYKENVAGKAYEIAQGSETSIVFFTEDERLYMQRNLVQRGMEAFGALTLELKNETVFRPMKNIAMVTDATIWLNDIPVPMMGEAMTGMEIEKFPISGSVYIERENEDYIAGVEKTDNYEFRYLIHVDKHALGQQADGFKMILMGLCILLVPLMGIVILFFHRMVSRPVGILNNAAAEIEKGNFGIQVSENFHSKEFQFMAGSFNAMSDTLKNQFEKLFKEELALRDAKIMALQLQINPHFLNNTLEIINWEARLAGDVKVSRMLESLSVMLSATMDRKHERIVHLSEEMMYVDAYLYIISERLGKRLSVEKNIDPELQDFYVPRLVMQPIIENAVEHGIQPLQKGLITIRVYRDEESVVLEVENDGIMTNEDEEKIAKLLDQEQPEGEGDSYNLGIRNVNQRLKIIYGDEAGLYIKMNKNQHTVAKIIIPIHQQQQ